MDERHVFVNINDDGTVKSIRGRPQIGQPRTIKITLPPDCWAWLEEQIQNEHAKTLPELIRAIIMAAKGN